MMYNLIPFMIAFGAECQGYVGMEDVGSRLVHPGADVAPDFYGAYSG